MKEKKFAMKSKKSKTKNKNEKILEMIKKILNNYDEIKKCLSEERLIPYKEIAMLSPKLDIALYNSIQLQSSLLFLPLQYLEVCLRNKINESLYQFYRRRSFKISLPGLPEEWYKWMPTSKNTTISIKNIMRNITTNNVKGYIPTAGDIISHLSFGTLRHILQERPDNKDPLYFWNGIIHEIFLNTKNKKETILQTLANINNTRNRLFHYEPIWKTKKNNLTVENALQNIKEQYDLIYEFIGWMSIPLQNYMSTYTFMFNQFLKSIKTLHSDLAKELKNPKLSFLLRQTQ